MDRRNKIAWFSSALALIGLFADPGSALERVALRERDGSVGSVGMTQCALPSAANGTFANYHWYNLCSGYTWIYSGWQAGEAVGVRFGGPNQPLGSLHQCAFRMRAIAYFRNIVPNYGQTVDFYLDGDANNDGCSEGVLSQALNVDPALRWNCIQLGDWASGSISMIVRQVHRGDLAPSFVTDGPHARSCDPVGVARSFYYGVNGSACMPWQGPTNRADNFLTWLVIDWGIGTDDFRLFGCCMPDGSCVRRNPCACLGSGGRPIWGGPCSPGICATAAESRSWGSIKALYH